MYMLDYEIKSGPEIKKNVLPKKILFLNQNICFG